MAQLMVLAPSRVEMQPKMLVVPQKTHGEPETSIDGQRCPRRRTSAGVPTLGQSRVLSLSHVGALARSGLLSYAYLRRRRSRRPFVDASRRGDHRYGL